MTIRTRLTLWYAGILFVSILLISGLLYHELVLEKRGPRPVPAPEQDEGDDVSEDVVQIFLWCGVPAALLGLAGGWWLMRRALAPLTALTAAAARIQEHNLKERLPCSGNGDEMDRLTEVFNAMTARLDGSFQRIREFTLHASHELKTPLTVLHGELETVLRDPGLAEPRREHLLSQLDEVRRLAKIVDGLTLLTKADAGQVALAREPVRLDELVRDAHADAQILAAPGGVRVELADCEKVTIRGDRHRLRQLLLNLTDNAIKYNQPGGTVTFSVRLEGGQAGLEIANTGPGIPSELLPHVFERFFRGDASHNSAVDGCGLGLSIVQWIVNAHGGTVRLDSEPGKLTTVRVRLPVVSDVASLP